MRQKDEVERR